MKKIYVCKCETPDKYADLFRQLNQTEILWRSGRRPLGYGYLDIREARFIYMHLSSGRFRDRALTWTTGKWYFAEGHTYLKPVARVSPRRFVKIAAKYFPRKN